MPSERVGQVASSQRPHVTDADVAEWRRLRAQGLSLREIAERFPFARETIREYIAGRRRVRKYKPRVGKCVACDAIRWRIRQGREKPRHCPMCRRWVTG
jgi:IS30 family transposase